MTVETEVCEITHVGNGVATQFDFSFPVHKKTDLTVTKISIATGVEVAVSPGEYDFTITESYTGYITYPLLGDPLSSNYRIKIFRDPAVLQEYDVSSQTRLDRDGLELTMDRQVMMIAALKNSLADLREQFESLGEPDEIYNSFLANMRWVNPVESRFGAAGDDSTDDTDAIQAAVNYLNDLGGGTVIINHPHKITDTILVESGKINFWFANNYSSYFRCVGAFTALKYEFPNIREYGAPILLHPTILRSGDDTTSTAIRIATTTRIGDAAGEISGANMGPRIVAPKIDNTYEAGKSVTAASAADPALLTTPSHGFSTGDIVRLESMEGGSWPDLNDAEYSITVVSADTYSLDGIDAAAYGTYAGGGIVTRQNEGYWFEGISLHQVPHTKIVGGWIKGRGSIASTKYGAGIRVGNFCNGTRVSESCTIRGFYGGLHIDDTEFFEEATTRVNSTQYNVGDIIKMASNPRFRFVCTTAGVSAGSEPVGYATAGNRDEVTDGLAVFVGAGFQAEGIEMVDCKTQANYIGFYSSITSVENSWVIERNGMDNGWANVALDNGIRVSIKNNLMGWNNRRLDHVDIFLQRTDGNLATDAHKISSLISGNSCFRGGNLDLVVSAISRGATTTLTYTKAASDPHPEADQVLFLASVEGTVELNNKPFFAGTVTPSGDTGGTVVMLDYHTGLNIDSTNYGAFTNSARLTRYGRFVEIGDGEQVDIVDNHIAGRNVGLHAGPDSADIWFRDNAFLTSANIEVYSVSTSPGTIYNKRHAQPEDVVDGGAPGNGVDDDTEHLQAILDDGRSIKGDPSKTYRLQSQLQIMFDDTGIDWNGAQVIISTKTGHFRETNSANIYAATAVPIYAYQVDNAFVKNGRIVSSNYVDSGTILDDVYHNVIYFNQCGKPVISGNEIHRFSRGNRILLQDCTDIEVVDNYIHHCMSNTATGTAATAQVTGICVDPDCTIGTKRGRIAFNTIQYLGSGPTLYAAFGEQSDGIGIFGNRYKPSRNINVHDNNIAFVGDGVDCYGKDIQIINNQMHRCFNQGVKVMHGADNVKVDGNMITESGLRGVVVAGSGNAGAGDTTDVEVSNNHIAGYGYGGDWIAGDGTTKMWDVTANGTSQDITAIAKTTSTTLTITYTGADPTAGDRFWIDSVAGMTEVNGLEGLIVSVNAGANTLVVNCPANVDWGAYTSGGKIRFNQHPWTGGTETNGVDIFLISNGITWRPKNCRVHGNSIDGRGVGVYGIRGGSYTYSGDPGNNRVYDNHISNIAIGAYLDTYLDLTIEDGRPTIVTAASHALLDWQNNIIGNRAGTITLTLPNASRNQHRTIRVITWTANTIVSASSNVVGKTGGAAGTAICAATAGDSVVLKVGNDGAGNFYWYAVGGS